MAEPKNTRTTTIDALVGENVRVLRMARGISIGVLAQHIGVAWQQMQKYENGQNRVAPDRLYRIATYFGQNVDRLFQGAERDPSMNRPVKVAPPPRLTDKDLRLAGAFADIGDGKIKEHLRALIHAMADVSMGRK